MDLIIAGTPDPMERQDKLIALQTEWLGKVTEAIRTGASGVSSAAPGMQVTDLRGIRLPSSAVTGPGGDVVNMIGKAINDANADLRQSMEDLKTALDGSWTDNMGRNTDAILALAQDIETAATGQADAMKAEISIDNTQTINITGATEMVQQIMNALNTRGFVTEEELNDIRATLFNIIDTQIRSGATRPGAIFR